ncbi:MAG: hypothetical protein GY723_08605 [bacterium]|nr:hypothetical protein [bacterium]MCP5070834.1 hypothetical protein [bacterium]
MKSGDGSFRHASTHPIARPVVSQGTAAAPTRPDRAGLSKRAQRRFEASEERRRRRKERKRTSQTQGGCDTRSD